MSLLFPSLLHTHGLYLSSNGLPDIVRKPCHITSPRFDHNLPRKNDLGLPHKLHIGLLPHVQYSLAVYWDRSV